MREEGLQEALFVDAPQKPAPARKAGTPLSVVSRTYRLGELFAGAGGMALGASLARHRKSRFSHIWVNDINRDACATLQSNLKILPENVKCCPVQELKLKQLDAIDGLAFGFPCNDFSNVGERKGISGEFGGLYKWGARALHHFRPLFFVAENVTGLSSSGDENDLPTILKAFGEAGYDCFPHVYRFERYGLPQARHRMIIVGFRKDLKLSFTQPPENGKLKTCREALESPPVPATAHNHERTANHPRVIERLKHIKPGQNAFTADIPQRLRLNMKSGATISQIYRRLDPKRPAYTVTGSGGGGTHVYHWDEPRALTNRERARLQTFPDKFAFSGGKESVRKQIGMAVPPEGAKIVFQAVLKILIDNDIPNIKC